MFNIDSKLPSYPVASFLPNLGLNSSKITVPDSLAPLEYLNGALPSLRAWDIKLLGLFSTSTTAWFVNSTAVSIIAALILELVLSSFLYKLSADPFVSVIPKTLSIASLPGFLIFLCIFKFLGLLAFFLTSSIFPCLSLIISGTSNSS